MQDALERLRQLRLAPVIVIDDPADAEPLAEALVAGGLPCAEVTFRTAAAAEAIRRMTKAQPEMLVGAGTVLTTEQAAQAREAGAQFIVSPGFNPVVVDYCLERGIPIFPGVCTPTEIEAGLQRGLKVLKFFPAEPAGGLSYLKAISAPYSMVEFIPTGGINAEKLPAYLSFRSVVACGGSWMAPSDWIRAGQFDRIREETAKAVEAIRQTTGERT
ncbi:MAG TPA: bifunctional 4-hydroxy-2-oxoglutarate aldolase/2-dehydro-3-deoxy-phosphogluconate aldolase [Longimicrobiaceae bacterium]